MCIILCFAPTVADAPLHVPNFRHEWRLTGPNHLPMGICWHAHKKMAISTFGMGKNRFLDSAL